MHQGLVGSAVRGLRLQCTAGSVSALAGFS